MTIRNSMEKDIDQIIMLIKGIAEYEKLLDQVTLEKDILKKWIFDEKLVKVLIAEDDNEVVGFALYFLNFSTFLGKPGMYLEDLYVIPEKRGKGIGRKLFLELIKICEENDYERMDWMCLKWNQPSIEFYESFGAKSLDEWTTFRLINKKNK